MNYVYLYLIIRNQSFAILYSHIIYIKFLFLFIFERIGKKSNFDIRSIDKLTYIQGKFILFQLRFKNPFCSNKLKTLFTIVLRDTLWPINKLINVEIRFARANPSLMICFGSIFLVHHNFSMRLMLMSHHCARPR